MKPLIYILAAIVLLTVASCKKETVKPEPQQTLIGKWKFETLTGGINGLNVVADPSQVDVIEFKTDNTFARSTNGELTSTGSYNIFRGASIFSAKMADILTYVPVHGQPSVVTLITDTLTLAENVTDGLIIKYSRVK